MGTTQVPVGSLPGDPFSQGRRSAMEMACGILGALAEGPSKPTHILHKANMSWNVLSTYLDYLYGTGLVERVRQGEKRTEYRLTEKGRGILRLYEGLKLSLTGAANVYPSREAFPLVEKLAVPRRPTQWSW